MHARAEPKLGSRMDTLTCQGGRGDDDQGLQQRARTEPAAGQGTEAVTWPTAVPGVAETRHCRECAAERQYGQVDPARLQASTG